MDIDIAVVGSLNYDLTILTPRLPRPGETVLGTGHHTDNGGKGANQAVAAARLGSRVAMIGRVGSDDHGVSLVDGLERELVDTSGVAVDSENQTGLAVITVDSQAENTIVVSSGANSGLSESHIATHRPVLSNAKVLLAQLEVPIEAVTAAALASSGMVCLNPAPAPAPALPSRLAEAVDVLIPNRSELALLADVPLPNNAEELRQAVSRLTTTKTVVVTLGSEGAFVVENDAATLVPAHAVDAIDPTGAGDAFCGALAHRLSNGDGLLEATRWAVAAGAVATTRRGAQASMPTADEVEALLSA